jgi:site-specific recombinase XerC
MDFAAWMKKNHYRASTIAQTLSDLRRAQTGTHDVNVINALRRYSTWATEFGVEDPTTELADALGVGGVKRLPSGVDTSRKLEAMSFTDQDWAALIGAVEGSADPRDQVLWCMTRNGLRVGDMLRVERQALAGLFDAPLPVIYVEVKGGKSRPVPIGIREPWEALAQGLLATKAKNVAQYVSPGMPFTDDVRGSAAYERVHRRLKAHQRKLGLSGRANSHRIRRTIAVKTLEATDNMRDTQNMLGHVSQNSTVKYVDEVNLRRVAKLQRKIAGLE